MQPSDMLFGTFRNKYDQGALLVKDFYDDAYFSDVYNQMCETINDKDQYLAMISRDQKVLEIGTGSGRMFHFLTDEGYDVSGVEPAGEMLKFINPLYRHKVYQIGIEVINSLGMMQFDCIIIPATTVSLFDFATFEQFLKDATNLLTENGEIIFDFWDENYVDKLDDSLQKVKIDGKSVFYSNFIRDEQLIFNMYTKTDEKGKLGVSKKYIYTEKYLREACAKYGYSYALQEVKDHCKMVRLAK
ncbi:class I SAM-dependent methyltransferase [Listeria cornellensis]|uniref:Methyltransferase domain-containing protein n=1 Tax=Listeria cornellensis FSL F6-0969 TaxID=1265820 RepID=W7BN30_9LIST|nr:class I SAM-dependent methyltransferase [Listeria cornellensis]EUJ26325.1 hypothetical protein PCORN_15111 [Listeria cornellensis FSL F6-0969]